VSVRTAIGGTGREAGTRALASVGTTVTPVSHQAWDGQLDRFADSSFEQSALYAAGRWGEERVEAVEVRQAGRLIGGAVLVRVAPKGVPLDVRFMKFGPLWRLKGAMTADARSYRSVLYALVAEYGKRGGAALLILQRPSPLTATVERDVMAELDFRPGRTMDDPNRYLVDATLPETEQLTSLDQKWRYNLKHAKAAGLDVREEGTQGFADFTALHAAMIARKGDGASTDKVELLPALDEVLAAPARPRLMMARKDGVPVAGAIFGLHGDTAYYLFGASSDAALPLKAGYAVQWAILGAIRDAGVRDAGVHDAGVRWYDLGGEAGEEGLRQFKKGLAGKRGAIVELPSEFHWAGTLRAKLALNGLDLARQAAGLVDRVRPRR
jgi:hypothetical protein